MDGIHDLGGMHGFGPVKIEKEDYIFRTDWQRKAFGLTQAVAGVTPNFSADVHRQEIERIRPADYLAMDYFDKWTTATGVLLENAGLVNRRELQTGKKEFDVDRTPISAEVLVGAMKAGAQLDFPNDPQPAKFKVGQTVRVVNTCKKGHTRVPRYLRRALGTILEDTGVFQFADSIAAGQGRAPQHCYRVAFSAKSLWGEDAEANDTINADLWESYLEAA